MNLTGFVTYVERSVAQFKVNSVIFGLFYVFSCLEVAKNLLRLLFRVKN